MALAFVKDVNTLKSCYINTSQIILIKQDGDFVSIKMSDGTSFTLEDKMSSIIKNIRLMEP